MKPPCSQRLGTENEAFGHSPRAKSVPSPRNTTITVTLMLASQNSTSPNERTEIRLVTVKTSSRITEASHTGMPGNHPLRMAPPTVASNAITPTQKYQ